MLPATLFLMALDLKTLQRIAWALAGWSVVFLVVLAGRPSFSNASLPVRGVADPVVALQMARNVAALARSLVGAGDGRMPPRPRHRNRSSFRWIHY